MTCPPTNGDNTKLRFSLRWVDGQFYFYIKDFKDWYRVPIEHIEDHAIYEGDEDE